MTARHIVCTEFNWDDPEGYLKDMQKKCDYVVGQLEKCPTTGKVHLQWAAYSKTPLRWGFVKCAKFFKKYGKGEDMISYAMKEETRVEGPWSFGVAPTAPAGGRPKNMDLIKGDLIKMVEEDKVNLLQYPKLKVAKQKYILDKEVKETRVSESSLRYVRRGAWVVGKPRSGKSTLARKNNPYIKMPNKWWDEYLGEEEVLLEDVEPSMKSWLGYFLKIWTDWWQFRCEIKGGSILIGPFKKFWVTSNYTIEEVFGTEDQALIDALYERFEIITL